MSETSSLIPAMKEAAERATPGDWTVDVRPDMRPEEADVSGNFIVSSVRETSDDGQHSWAKVIAGASCCCCGSGGVWEPEDAAHIALSSPKNVLALISVVEEARAALVEAEDTLARHPFSTELGPDGKHPSPRIERIRVVLDRINTLINVGKEEGSSVAQSASALRGAPSGSEPSGEMKPFYNGLTGEYIGHAFVPDAKKDTPQ